jgi:hypothetical protein
VALGEVHDGETEVRSSRGNDTRGSDVVGNRSGEETEATADLDELDVAIEVSDHEEHEGDVKEEEEGSSRSVGSERGHEHDEGEDEPRREEEAKSVVELMSGSVSVTSDDTRARKQDSSVADPESAVGSEGGSTEGVATDEFPHAGQKLGKTTIGKSHTDDDIGSSY